MLVEELGFSGLLKNSTTILNDNLSAIASLASGGKHEGNKQYKNRMNPVIRVIEEELVGVKYVEISKMLADMLTKPLVGQTIASHCGDVGLLSG